VAYQYKNLWTKTHHVAILHERCIPAKKDSMNLDYGIYPNKTKKSFLYDDYYNGKLGYKLVN
jgi:hypothetical protein